MHIDTAQKKITIRHIKTHQEEELQYDKLVLATGANPVRPPFPGNDLDNVFMLSNLHEAEKIKKLMIGGKVGRAVVVGGGAIGIEIAEAMTDLWV